MSDNTAADLSGTQAAVIAAPKRSVGRPGNDPTTKLAKCKALFLTLVAEGKNRSEILDAFEQIDAENGTPITRGTAQVYYHEAKNAAIEAGVIKPKKTAQRPPDMIVNDTLLAPLPDDNSASG
jgi:hypothetical protein